MNRFVLFLLALAVRGATPFDYDASGPLDYRETKIADRDGVSIFDASYSSPKGGRVRCFVVAPDRKGRFAGIVWQHGGGQNRTWFLPDAEALARTGGAVSILMDAPDGRPKDMQREKLKDDVEDFQLQMIQVVTDARRGFDVLAARSDVDKDRIGYVGLSFGAMMGGSLAGIDKRFRTFVLICGLEGFARHFRVSQHPSIASMRESMPKDEFDRLVAAAAPIDAIQFIGKSSPTPLLFQSARFDPGVSESDSKDFYAAAGEPKELKWYDSGHDLNDPQAFADRAAWLRKYLRIQ